MISRTRAVSPYVAAPQPALPPQVSRALAVRTQPVVVPAASSDVPEKPHAPSLRDRVVLHLVRAVDSVRSRRLRSAGFVDRTVTTPLGSVRILERPRQGDGPTWVFCHGFAGQAANWAPMMRALAPHCGRLIALDLPGHGLTPPVDGPKGPVAQLAATASAAVSKLLDEDGHPCVVVGASMGGLAAGRYAVENPQRVKGALLMSPLGAPMNGVQLDALVARFTPESRDCGLGQAGVGKPRLMGKVVDTAVRALMGQPYLRALLHDYRKYTFFTAADLQKMPAESLIIWGQHDRAMPEDCRKFFFKNMPSTSTCVHAPNYDHLPILFAPKQLSEDVLKWTQTHAPDLLNSTSSLRGAVRPTESAIAA